MENKGALKEIDLMTSHIPSHCVGFERASFNLRVPVIEEELSLKIAHRRKPSGYSVALFCVAIVVVSLEKKWTKITR